MRKSCVLKVTIQEIAKNVECIMEIEKSCVLKVTIQEIAKNVECIMEIEKSCVLKVTIQEIAKNVECIMEIEKFSSLNRLYRVTAYVRRFIHNFRAKQKGVLRKNGELSRDEMIGAERVWILAAQAKLKNQDNYADLAKELRIVEYNGLLKCRGRLNNSDLSLEGKQPIILPRDHCLTKLVINECHNRVFHSGLRSTLAQLRSRFWVPKGRQKVKNIIKDCWVCRKIQGQSFSPQPVADLPEFRVREAPAFANVGIDFAGPLYVKEKGGSMSKCYIAVFSRCVTRAVHLELVPDLSTMALLNCLRRFAARRGTPQLILSDNAKTFKAAK